MSRFAVLEHDEITMLRAAVDTLELSEVAGEALHLERGVGRRVWLVQSRTGQFTYEVPDHDTLPGRPLAISDRIRRFAAVFTDTPVELSLADDATVVATADTASAAVDLVASHGESPQALRFEATATATVPLMRFHSLMWSARTVPLGIEDPDYPFPPMWLQIADGSIGLHVDWSDFLPSRATYRLGATTHRGSATVANSPLLVETFLARVLEARQVPRVGGGQPIPVDVRVVAATNRPLRESVERGQFRSDLFYRLNVVPVAIPPLTERREDIPPLVEHFVAHYATERRVPTPEVAADAMVALQSYEWPGNVRQLRNVVEATVILAPAMPVTRSVSGASRGALEVTSKPRQSRKNAMLRSRLETVRLV